MTNTPSTTPVAPPAFDPARYKSTTADQWQAAAAAWYAWGPVIDTWLGDATETMLDLAGVGTGSKVLDVAAGAGGQSVAAARRVGLTGHVLATDISPRLRIGLLGLSMGGEEAIGAATADPAVRAVVAEGATHRTAADKAGDLPGGVTAAVQRGLDQLTYGTAALLSPARQPGTLHSAVAHARTTPFLHIAAGKGVDEPDAVAYLHTAAPDRVQTWTVPGASHVHGLATSPAEWTARVTAFLDHALGVSAG